MAACAARWTSAGSGSGGGGARLQSAALIGRLIALASRRTERRTCRASLLITDARARLQVDARRATKQSTDALHKTHWSPPPPPPLPIQKGHSKSFQQRSPADAEQQVCRRRPHANCSLSRPISEPSWQQTKSADSRAAGRKLPLGRAQQSLPWAAARVAATAAAGKDSN